MQDAICQALRALGITSCYRGFNCAALAILLAAEEPARLLRVMEGVYQPAAQQLGTGSRNVERNIRTVIKRAWQVDSARLTQMAGYRLDGPPSASQFIEIVANHVLQGRARS